LLERHGTGQDIFEWSWAISYIWWIIVLGFVYQKHIREIAYSAASWTGTAAQIGLHSGYIDIAVSRSLFYHTLLLYLNHIYCTFFRHTN